ncbi:thioesterase family protein [Paludibacterium denitrificans]|uniref:Thioesterase n=1 Tax=Paludibacterium denitrificans TaxID=2675226 RepID=A0A844GDV4_9NEIS|nr:thioesterase family protein [Paludibacterium denitrificans]MTD33829.1 thioesterase [Paludibacterium denitrificans]
MARIKLDLPERVVFDTTLDVRIGDINYGGHLANDAFLRLAHEARLRFLKSLGYTEMDVEGAGIIMTDAAIVYRAEAFHGDRLTFRLGLSDFNPYGFDLMYQVVDDNTGKEVARLKTGIVFFDYTARKIQSIPAAFAERFTA